MQRVLYIFLLMITVTTMSGVTSVFAQSAEIDDLSDEVANRESKIDSLQGKMDQYRSKVRQLSSKTAGLMNDIEMIENQVALSELDIESTRAGLEKQRLEIEITEEKIGIESITIESQKDMLEEMLFSLHKNDKVGFIEVLFSAKDFNTMFAEIEQLESLNADLNKTLNTTKVAKTNLEDNQQRQKQNLDNLVDLEMELKQKIDSLTENQGAKKILISETQNSESQYRVLMSELRQERQYITTQISQLQAEIERKIREASGGEVETGSPGVFIHPLPTAITTATYHDPTYPFRHLFEHSGYDFAKPTGSPIRASAPGVVAWTRLGRSYGNYVMIIHEGGFATLYAHMSGFNVVPDQFVSRGDVIGYVGSTGFSTGPHLHFEVRLNGIPVNPATYVTGL